MTTIEYSDTTPDVSFSYDRLGRKQTITDGLGSRTFAYLPTLELDTEIISGLYSATITRSYDGLPGRYNGFSLGSGYQVKYDFDGTGRLNNVNYQTSQGSGTVNYGYLEDSNLLETVTHTQGGATSVTTYSYEEKRNLKTRVENAHNLSIISSYVYQYDSMGRRKNVKNAGSAFAAPAFNVYGYNDRSEVTGSARYEGEDLADLASPVPDQARDYSYDAIGNRETAGLGDGSSKVDIDYTANALNQYEEITGGEISGLSYDADGNMTGYNKEGVAMRLSFNGENRLVAIVPATPAAGATRSEYLYDFQGRRVVKTFSTWDGTDLQSQDTDYFLYDGWNMIAELDETVEATAEYVWGLDLSQSLQGAGGFGGLLARVDVVSAATHTYFYDGNGNVGQLMASDGSLAARYEYDPFGNTFVADGPMAQDNPYRFSTKYHDGESGLYYYGYRYYSAELGRWVSRDPIGERGGVNLYGFVKNNSIRLVDYLGQKVYWASRDMKRPIFWGNHHTLIIIPDNIQEFRRSKNINVQLIDVGGGEFGFSVGGFNSEDGRLVVEYDLATIKWIPG